MRISLLAACAIMAGVTGAALAQTSGAPHPGDSGGGPAMSGNPNSPTNPPSSPHDRGMAAGGGAQQQGGNSSGAGNAQSATNPPASPHDRGITVGVGSAPSAGTVTEGSQNSSGGGGMPSNPPAVNQRK
ncbi:MAG: hypothetical protein JOZ17_17605 [Acetobacteraceae bacterium]|nr:hypothetical protein [Acetobacteraceae bacterium]